MSKRICYVTASYPFGKGEAFVGTEIEAWRSRGYTLTVVPTYCRGERVHSDVEGRVIALPLFSVRFIASVVWWMLRCPLKSFKLWTDLLQSPRNLPKNAIVTLKAFVVARYLKEKMISHIHAHWGGTSSTMAMALSSLTGIPWSLTCHRWDIYTDNLLSKKSRSAVFSRFISERGRVDAMALGVPAQKSLVIHMGVRDIAHIPVKHRPANNPVIACPANLIEVKGHRYLIEAIALLKKEKRQVNLLLFGDGELRGELERLCSVFDVCDLVEFKGHCKHESLMRMYGGGEVDLVVLPSVELGRELHEGIPVSLMEAMGFGIPVISTKTGSIPELLPEVMGLTVRDQDPVALAAKISEILFDAERYAGVAHQVLSRIAKDWTVDAVISEMERRMLFK